VNREDEQASHPTGLGWPDITATDHEQAGQASGLGWPTETDGLHPHPNTERGE